MKFQNAQTRRTFLATFAGASAMTLVACGGGSDNSSEGASDAAAGGTADAEKADGVMTYQEYMDAAVNDEVTIEAYVQGKQSWWENKATLYLQDADGGYFSFETSCTEEDYDKLVEGQKVKITGYKADFEGEIEISDGTVEIEDGNFVAAAVDITDKLGTDELINFQNQKVAFTGMTIEASDNGEAFAYKGEEAGDDIYFKASIDGATYDFTIEVYLTGPDTDVYKAVEGLKVGDTVDMEGFLYWYQGANPHITKVTVK